MDARTVVAALVITVCAIGGFVAFIAIASTLDFRSYAAATAQAS